MMKVWDERNVEDLASLALISESTKPCPKCKTPIEVCISLAIWVKRSVTHLSCTEKRWVLYDDMR